MFKGGNSTYVISSHTHTHIHTYTQTHTDTYTHTDTHRHTHTHTQTHTHTHRHTHTHTHTHTHQTNKQTKIWHLLQGHRLTRQIAVFSTVYCAFCLQSGMI